MSEEIGAGVKILLERGKSNPDEVMGDYGMWGPLVEAVFTCVETGQRSSRIRGLTDHEIKLLFEMFNAIYRTQFDSWVMKNVLGAGDEEERPLDAYGLSLSRQRLQGIVQPGTWQNVATQTSDTPLRTAIKRKLGIK
jgi:hypothetical protein